ncbi:iron complex transport system substrate-binding protein [Sinosporangium album]|uniref:Iron complex transport system substrate-binding protein n=1 Tax=Sinosporangium album TaxID=504805 RepID=A0A1G8KPH6_9ACTN|nr:ABC transporter substrate-binding protein [Sinosporangium album]SDI45286.1 iron complex transport system substrate-binding protein [Sinosporangium album]
MTPRPLIPALALALALALAGCGAPSSGTASSAGSAPAASGPPSAEGFPVTVTHGLGTTTIPHKPRRVVALGFADAQIAAALDAPVVGVARNPSAKDGNWPGVTPPYPAALQSLDSLTPNLERVAALKPDLILMTTAQPAFGSAYARLSTIAPVIPYKNELLQDSGDDLTLMIGQALGESAKATELVARSRERLAAFAAEHPTLKGKKYVFGQQYSGNIYIVAAPDGPSAAFFSALGMKQPDELAALPVQQGGAGQLSEERLDLLDTADVGFFGVYTDKERAEFEGRPLASSLDLVKKGNLHYVTLDDASLLLGPNPAVTETLLERLRPALEKIAR